MAQMGPEQAVPADPKKKGESHRGMGFTEKEDKCLCESLLAVSHDCINGAQQKGLVYWRKVVQEYHKSKLHICFASYRWNTSDAKDRCVLPMMVNLRPFCVSPLEMP